MEIKVGRDLGLFPSLIRGDFEHDELQIVSGLELDSGVSIWDVGANIGVYSIFFAKIFKNAKIVSFEPCKSTFELLKENLSHNKCEKISLFNCGLGQSTESQFLIESDLGPASNSIVLQEGPLGNTREKIEMTTIDVFISNFPDLAPKLIKIDVEGYEPQVIMGGEVFIKSQKPIIMMEVFPLLWNKNSYADWRACLDFLFMTYGQALGLGSHDSRVIRSFNFERNQNQRTLFFGLKKNL